MIGDERLAMIEDVLMKRCVANFRLPPRKAVSYGDLEIGTWKSVLLHAPLSKASKVASG